MTKHPPGSFCWFECGSTDAKAAKAFYTGAFGWDVRDVPMPEGCEGHYTLFQIDGNDIAGLYQLQGPQFKGVPSHWMAYVAVDSADESVARAKQLGADVFVEPMDVPNVGRIAFVQDPTGARIGIFQAGLHAGRALEPSMNNLGWCELHTPDPERAMAFYTEWFGWSTRDSGNVPQEYTEFLREGQSIGGMMKLQEQHGTPPYWLSYASVPDCDTFAARVEDLGGEVRVPPQDVPNVGRFCVFTDPTGAAMAAIQLVVP